MSAEALSRSRSEALEAFRETPLPAPTVETWRRFPREAFAFERLDGAEAAPLAPVSRAHPAGVEVRPLEEAAAERPELLAFSAGAEFRRLEAANLAMWRGGAFVRVPKGVKVSEPIHLEFRHDPARPYAFPRVHVEVEEGAEAVIVEEHVGGAGASAAFSSVSVGAGAKATLVYVQDLTASASHFWRQSVRLAKDAVLEHASVLWGARRAKTELDVFLEGTGAHARLRGVILGRGEQVCDARTSLFHRAGRTTSDLSFRAALRDRARSLYTGLLRIERDAPDCEAHQANRNLLLSDAARADSTPILEILPARVACKHAAASGPVDPAELFYLASRGLDPVEAERALVMAFLQAHLDEVPAGPLRERLTERVTEAAA